MGVPSTVNADANAARDTMPAGSVSMAEALERLLPRSENNPYKVAARLDAQHRERGVRLLGGNVVIAPDSNPSMLGIEAHTLSDGKSFLYVQVRKDIGPGYPVWDGETVLSLEKHHDFWAFERESFQTHLSEKRSGGGRPKIYGPEDRERVLTEAAMALYEEGLPNPLTEDGLADMVSVRIGNSSPGSTLLKEILKPLYKRLKDTMRER
jgi:hypothetical protein